MNKTINITRTVRAGSARREAAWKLPAALCAVQIVLAYEWLISGLNKLANLSFATQLAGNLKQSLNGNPYGWYVSFLRDMVLPHAGIFGVLTELGETAIGLTLLAGALICLLGPNSRLALYASGAAVAALAGAAFLSLNYFLQGGSPLPWLNPANAFQEGVDIDILIPLLAVVLLGANLRAVRAGFGRRISASDTRAPVLQAS